MKAICFFLLLAGVLSCAGHAATESSSAATEDSMVIENITDTATVACTSSTDGVSGATDVANHTSFNGVLMIPPQRHATVTVTMGGIIQALSIIDGQFVRKGALLATLKNPEFIELQQNYLDASAQLEYLETEYRRQQVLCDEEAASRKKLEQSKAEYLSMKSRKEAAAAQLLILGVDAVSVRDGGIQPYLQVKAPFDGYITMMGMNLGSFVNPGEKVCDVINKQETLLCLTAYEKDLGELAVGRPVYFRVNGMGEQVFEASVLSIGQQVDATSRALDVYARVNDNNPRFRPGMYVSARIGK